MSSKFPHTPKWKSPFEMDMLLLEPVLEMMQTGIRIDLEEKERLQEEAISDWDKKQELLDKLVGAHVNVESSKQVPWLLYDHLRLPKKWKTDRRTRKKTLRADEAALRELMATCREKVDHLKTEDAKTKWKLGFLICRQIISIRRRRKEISSFLGLSIKKGEVAGPSLLEDEDGRMRYTISVGGTETARFAHSKTLWGSGLNIATVPHKLRSMYIPDEGYELAEFDLHRGESWIYAHLSEDPELLRIHYEDLDFHAETAAALSSEFDTEPRSVEWIIENKDGAGYKLRYVGKRVNHSASYRMRNRTGAAAVNKESDETGITVTPSEFDKALQIWLIKYGNVKSKWWPEIEGQLSIDRTMMTPYGREITYFGYWGDDMFREATAYVPQSTSVDYLNIGFLKVYHEFAKRGAWDLQILTQTHDSILVQYKIEHRYEAIPAIQEVLGTESLTIKGRTFSIPIESSYGQSWGDLKSYDKAA